MHSASYETNTRRSAAQTGSRETLILCLPRSTGGARDAAASFRRCSPGLPTTGMEERAAQSGPAQRLRFTLGLDCAASPCSVLLAGKLPLPTNCLVVNAINQALFPTFFLPLFPHHPPLLPAPAAIQSGTPTRRGTAQTRARLKP